jgi:hypothetical protein
LKGGCRFRVVVAYAVLLRVRFFLGINRDFHAKNACAVALNECRGRMGPAAPTHDVSDDNSHTILLLN